MIVIRFYVNPGCPHCEALLDQFYTVLNLLPPGADVELVPVGTWNPRLQPVPPHRLPPHKQNWTEDVYFPGEAPAPRLMRRALEGRALSGAAREVAARVAYGTPQVEVEVLRPAPGGAVERRRVVFTGWDYERAADLLLRLVEVAWSLR